VAGKARHGAACTAGVALLMGGLSAIHASAICSPPVFWRPVSDRLGLLCGLSLADCVRSPPFGHVGLRFESIGVADLSAQLPSSSFWPPGCGHPFTVWGVEAVKLGRRVGSGCSWAGDHLRPSASTKRVPITLVAIVIGVIAEVWQLPVRGWEIWANFLRTCQSPRFDDHPSFRRLAIILAHQPLAISFVGLLAVVLTANVGEGLRDEDLGGLMKPKPGLRASPTSLSACLRHGRLAGMIAKV